MAKGKNLGDYFWRGGKQIELEKEEEFFTALVNDEAELERVQSLPGVAEVKPVQNRVFKVRIAEKQRDAAMKRFRSDEIKGVCHHAYRPKGATATRYYLTDQIVVKFAPSVSDDKIASILSETGTRIVREYPDSPNTFLLQVTSAAGKNPIKVANALADREDVEYAEPNLINRFRSSYIPQDTYFENQWHLRSWDGAGVVADADVSATDAWDITRGTRDIVVAVVDDGFDLSHPDFSGQGKIVHPKDYVDGDANPFPETTHGDYHGTPCAGVAIAEENGEGVVGIAPGCSFMPVRFPVGVNDDVLWNIFDFVGKRADVISCSWGPPPVNAPLSRLLNDKIHDLAITGGPRKKGCVIVFAAGNYNAPLNDPNVGGFDWYHPDYGPQHTEEPIYSGTAAHPDVIAVSASTSLNKKSVYSNWGGEISVCAPSDNWHPLDSHANVPGLGIWTTDNEQYGLGFTGGSRFTGHFGGTSSATPLVAGVAALVLSANPELSASEVRQILQDAADKIEDPDPDPVLNLNKGTYDADGHSEWFGYGKVNAARAVQRALELREQATGITDLEMGAATAAGNLAGTGTVQSFRLNLSPKFGITLTGPDGQDFDLYVKKGSPPTTEDYDARGYTGSANEKVTIQVAEPGEYYIMARSYRGSGDFQVSVNMEE